MSHSSPLFQAFSFFFSLQRSGSTFNYIIYFSFLLFSSIGEGFFKTSGVTGR